MPFRNVHRDLVGSVFNHLVLPPEIPGAQDSDIETASRDVLMRMIRSVETAMGLPCDRPWLEAYRNLQDSFHACLELNRGHLERNSLLQHFKKLQRGHMLILYLNEQNAGLLIRRDESEDGESVIFESFEASACASSVLAAGHAMQWDFPGRSAHISFDKYAEESFQQSLATFLEQASIESLYILQASAQKAGASVVEIRDTPDPALITQMLMSLLEAVGGHYQAPVLRKNIRDDVNIASGNIPWRRLPLWQVLRVAAQRQLCFALGAERGQISYKFLLAIVLAQLLDDSAPHMSPDKVVCLRTKLARRMAKLEMLQETAQLHRNATCQNWCIAASTIVRKSIENANMKMEVAWEAFKRSNTRVVPLLPHRAPPDSLKLTLPNSGRYLDEILSTKLLLPPTLGPITLPDPLDQSIQRSRQFTDCAFSLAALEQQIETEAGRRPSQNRNHGDHCLQLERQVREIIGRFENVSKSRTMCSTYESNPELKSATILAIFTLWVELDKSAIQNCQLLADHAPIFRPELLDALQLPTKLAMERLQKIQEYLADRHARSIYGTIFEIHDQGSFASRYVASSTHLQSLEDRIRVDYHHARQKKTKEHQNLCNEYDKRTQEIAQNCCICTFEDGEWNRKTCTKHFHMRVRRRLNIQVLEAFLPKNNPLRSALVFELGIPDWLSAYRDATWQIMSTLAHPHRPANLEKPEIHLQACEPLRVFLEAKVNRLSMASKIKCFAQTHYNCSQGKVPLTDVLLPFAADFQLYDSFSNTWVADLEKPLTLEHHCGIQIPRILQPVLPKKYHPPTIVDGPSSYEIQANQAAVPKDTPLQAFSACQKLLSGKRRRWPNLLVELSSSNLNLSDEDTMRLMSQVALQAGPSLPQEPLRAVHEIFRYEIFTTQLTRSLETMLESIRTNWREHNSMQLVITLALRLNCLSPESSGMQILVTARKCLIKWISELRGKAQGTQDSTEAQRYATYGLYAALLCRATFAILLDPGNHFSESDLREWVQASLAVQENTLCDLSNLSDALRGLLFSDAKMVYHLQTRLRSVMEAHRSVVATGILHGSSSQFLNDETTYASWDFLPEPHDHWIVATTTGPFPERIHFDYVEGHLLVNGKPRSKLPLNIADDDAVKYIFGDQHLITYPSNRPGLSHRLALLRGDNQVHFGLRNGHAIIRTIRYNPNSSIRETLEFIPQSKLRNNWGSFDLPAELIDNCGHWLNVNTRCLEIRRASPKSTAFWITRQRDWIIDVPRRRAYRGEGGSQLVDPQSDIFAKIADTFCDFERRERLTVFQPQNMAAKLTVELKHLDLHFEVHRNKLLYCQQLNAEIDKDQDAGTWYGLRSKIVMKEIDTENRSIIVPLGKPTVCRNDIHVDIHIQEASHYGRFMIDTIIGRLICSPEPRLIYAKALYHAITSFCLPDTLTGRTGSSEAFSILRSGTAQPWTPVSKAGNELFEEFISLAPRREYLPPNIKRIQKVVWNPNLTSSIQCDGYEQAIETIKERSANLEIFTTGTELKSTEISHLRYRGSAQRRLYDPLIDPGNSQESNGAIYTPRDRSSSIEAAQVHQISRVVLSHCSQFYMNGSLRSLLESSEILGGFSTPDVNPPVSNIAPLINQIEEPVNEKWGELVDFCRHTDDEASLLFRLGLLAFHKKANMDFIHSLATFCLVDEIKSLEPPRHQHFANFQSRERPSIDLLESLIKSTYPEFQPMKNKKGQDMWFDANNRDIGKHIEACEKEGLGLAKRIQKYWPSSADSITLEMLDAGPADVHKDPPQLLINTISAWDKIQPEWQRRFANWELSNYIMRVDEVLSSLTRSCNTQTLAPWAETEPNFVVTQQSLSYRSIVQGWAAKEGPVVEKAQGSLAGIIERQQDYKASQQPIRNSLSELAELGGILKNFKQSGDHLRKQYAGDLCNSLAAFGMRERQLRLKGIVSAPDSWELSAALQAAQTRVKNIWAAIATAYAAGDSRACWLKMGAIQPLSTVPELLKLLRSTEAVEFGLGMKEAIISYGIALTDVQHLIRIRHALSSTNDQALRNELREVGHRTWEPLKVPDWLLLEIDSNIIIRAEQVNVAEAMMDSTLGNGVLQLSKTSCIIPMVAAVLADGQNLSRVVVPKALIMQTAQTMQAKLGDLVGRKVVHIPYSRRTSTKKEILDVYTDLHHETRGCNGIMLTCAEHLLSYKLSGWQKLVDSEERTAAHMIKFQKWLDTHCRDVLDECDFTLSVRTQLNYPSGLEMAVDFSPHRWQVAQELLGLISGHLRELQRRYPRGIQVTSREDSFPSVQFLRADTENALHDLIMDDVCSGRLTLLRPIHPQYRQKQSGVRKALGAAKFSEEVLDYVANLFDKPLIAKDTFLLYGLHPDRDPIAVPYEAKGKPSEQAEYGHPDVAIFFTCLSFYYAGLTQAQLVQSVQHVLQSNDPAAQYECFASTCTKLPVSLRHWSVINTEDKSQMERLWHCLRKNRIAINHYLNHFVFPAHARQFEVKLQACSWDVPICLDKQKHLTRTSGFSGTNDNRLLLPLTISQRDLPELQHTSAEVLSYLLQGRNRQFRTIVHSNTKRSKERCFLDDLKANGISVLIDAGAYISEMGNAELAQTWLQADSEAKAVVYFRNDNRAWVHYKSNTKEDVPLLATPFAEDLTGCNVFLDEGHTRGVDLRLPANARGALTLALKLTKDHTVQAAMRLRQLQTTQSLCFYGPQAVESSIRDFNKLRSHETINSSHVVPWLLEQTCRSIEDLKPLYVAQGIDFCQRTDVIWNCHNFMSEETEREKILCVLRQPERKTVPELYGHGSEIPKTGIQRGLTSLQLRTFTEKLALIGKDRQGRIQAGALEEVEQEREVEAQVEQVREAEKRKIYVALTFPGVHPEILWFAQTGTLEASRTAKGKEPGFEHAFSFVGKMAIAKRYHVHETSSRLFASREFSNTVQLPPGSDEAANFLRPVEWILWSPTTETALVVIPEEAEYLLGFLRGKQGYSHTHLITYAAPVTKAMIHFNDLDFSSYPELPEGHTVPERIRIELGILAGRLYVDKDEWKGVAEYMKGTNDPDKIAADPAAFVLEWLTSRRKAVNVLHTHMGYICTGREMDSVDSAEDEDDTV
ncbi:hypothetical protein F5Y07DRAFT_410255 [Xylaria sp. FL0933]|nr:hypothetical protein F5Y07DRAFT_410255 [Xylaria sp. FL0933]